jgi:Zn-dependent protease with chaperone function
VSSRAPRSVAVATIGIACGAVLAWMFWALTGAAVVGLLIGASVASILVVLAVAGTRFNRTHQVTADRRAAALAKRERVRKAIEDSQRPR